MSSASNDENNVDHKLYNNKKEYHKKKLKIEQQVYPAYQNSLAEKC